MSGNTNCQVEFDNLQVECPQTHDEILLDARMKGIVSSRESRKYAWKPKKANTKEKKHSRSSYLLLRLVASFDKMCTYLCRHPRAQTHMVACETHALAGALETKERTSTY